MMEMKSRLFAMWLPARAHVERRRCVGVTASDHVTINNAAYCGAITVELYGFASDDEDRRARAPEVFGGWESAVLSPSGARELAAMLLKAAECAEAYLARPVDAKIAKANARSKDGAK